MANPDLRSRKNAERMIRKRGRLIQLVQSVMTGPEYDPTITETITPVYAICTDYEAREIDGSLIQSDDKKYMFCSEIAPATGDSIIDGGKRLSIVRLREQKPGEITIYHEAQARA